jgi:hypothetical protein
LNEEVLSSVVLIMQSCPQFAAKGLLILIQKSLLIDSLCSQCLHIVVMKRQLRTMTNSDHQLLWSPLVEPTLLCGGGGSGGAIGVINMHGREEEKD